MNHTNEKKNIIITDNSGKKMKEKDGVLIKKKVT